MACITWTNRNMQFSNSLRLGKAGSLLDSDVRAFAAASGATDLGGLDDLVKYVKAQGLWSNFRLYPMKSAQNAGSGLTVHGLGGLTANNATLVNSPTWGAGGITFNGTTHYGVITDFLDNSTLTLFKRHTPSPSSPSTRMALGAQFNTATNQRSWLLEINGTLPGDPFDLTRSADGTSLTNEIYTTTSAVYSNTDQCTVAQWVAGGGRSLWQNKTLRNLSLTGGAAQTSRFNASEQVVIGAALSPTAVIHFNGVFTTCAYMTGSLTTTQRETITDLINAL